MQSSVEKIKERLSIIDVVSSYLTVIQAGKNFKARCPFHNEKTPSFFISPERGTYYCFGCSAKGDIFSFVEQFEGVDFLGALKLLAERAGVTLEREKGSSSKDKKETYYAIMEDAAAFFESNFEAIPEAKSYIKNRGLTDQTRVSFRIGYAKGEWRSLADHLIGRGYKREDIETVGLIKSSEKGFYDRFRSRIIFPISDSSGRIIAFSGRIFALPTDQIKKSEIEEAKYLNSPDTPLFNKSNVLFGIDKAKSAIRSRGYSIIVEGQMDLILSHQASFTNTVAVSGTALAEETKDSESKINNLGLIRRLSQNIIFAFDGDEAGIRAASRSAMIALSLDMQVKIAVLPEGQDPADILSKGIDEWKDIIKNSVNIVSFHINRIVGSVADPRIRGRKIREIIFPFLSMVTSSIERSAYITEISMKTGLPESAIIEDFESYEKSHPDMAHSASKSDNLPSILIRSRRENLEQRLFGMIFFKEQKEMLDQELETMLEDFKHSIDSEVFKTMHEKHDGARPTLAFEAEMWYGTDTPALVRDIKEIILNLEEEILQENKAGLGPLDSEEKLAQFHTLAKRIEEIKQRRIL